MHARTQIASPIPKVPLPPFLHSNPDAVRDDRGGQEWAQRRVRGGEQHQNGQLRSQRTGSTVGTFSLIHWSAASRALLKV